MFFEAAFIGAVTALIFFLVLGGGFLAWRSRERNREFDDKIVDRPVSYDRPAGVARRRMHWGDSKNSGSSNKGYSEINKGPDRPARSRMAGKPGLVNQANRATADWKTDHIVSRLAGRRDAQKVKSRPARKPRPK
ncbi:MAG: hypothetical protein AAF213_11845 [Pseudomonadota bacterium]